MPTLEQLNQMPVDQILPELSGTLLSCMRYTEKDDPQYGHTAFQPGKLRLDSGETVNVVFKNQKDVSPLRGKHITLKSVSGEHGMTGVKVGEYQNNTQIIVTATAQIMMGAGGRGAPAGRGQPAGWGTPARGSAPATCEPRYTLDDLLTLWATIMSDSRVEAPTPDVQQAAASTVFIAATRDGIKAPPAPRPAPPAEAQPPSAESASQVPTNDGDDSQVPF